MRGGVPFLLGVGFHQEVVKIVEAEVRPAVSEVCGCFQEEDHLEILIVVLIGITLISQEAKPHSPFVQK